MAVSGSVQALIAAFFFGILLNTASAGFVLYIKGHGSAIFRDGLRLALILFLASSALWAQAEFLATLIDPGSTSTCQIAVIISSLLDQVARVSIEQFLLWATTKGSNSPAGIATQIILLARFIVGMVFVGETKPQFNSTCVPMSNLMPISIAVIALDAVILISIAVLAFTLGSNKNGQGGKAILLTVSALSAWMGTSVTMLLGLSTIDMFLRTTLPAIGLFVLTALVTMLSGTLTMPRDRRPRQPLESPTPQNMDRDRNLSTADSNEYPPSRYEEVKGMGGMTVTSYSEPNIQPKEYNNNSGLPTLARPVTGIVGIGGVPVQGQLFPPIRANTVDQISIPRNDVKPRPNLLARSKTDLPGKPGKGKFKISAPIPINDPEAQNAFDKIPTVDLATAAKNEQERREIHARRISALMASRPAPKPPILSPKENLAEDFGAMRKEVERQPSTEIRRSNSTKTSQTGGLSVEGNASTTSAQLSPGNEELRRRSPRQAIPSVLPAKTPTFQPITPGQPFRIPIPRTQPPPEPIPEKVSPEPVKTPLQRRPTNGLPSNPRAVAIKKLSEESSKSQPQTVMFINRISYDDPDYVNDIMQGAAKAQQTPLHSSNSVVHRPRPIPRKSDEDRQVYPAEVTYGHRRTKSGGSIMSRRSILKGQPGSPTQLPPLPPAPKSAGNIQRPQPNNTNSMTFDEKMSILYAGPASASSLDSANGMLKRKSSIPEMPPLPATYLHATQSPVAETSGLTEEARRLTRTTATDQTSIRTQSILGVEDFDDNRPIDVNHNLPDDFGNSWMTGVTPNNATKDQYTDGKRRQSSPVIPILRYSTISATSDGKAQYDTTVNSGSLHSPVGAVDMSGSRLNARSTWIKDSRLESVLSGFGDEVMTVMLDTSSEYSTIRQSFLLDDEEMIPDMAEVEKHRSGQWHHRIGDHCPTFSARKEKVKSRKMPPPTPLLLRAASNKNAIVIHTAEPSPIESPNAAYNMIQAQLRKIDEPNRDSVASEGRRMALLEDLELEMGQQESRWQTMQHNLDRDSISTLATDSRPVSIMTPVAKPAMRTSSKISVLAERRASRRARMLSVNRSKEDLLTSTMESDNPRASLFQSRLQAAQMEYMDNAPDSTLKRDKLNFFSVSKADLGSPTPPDTDESDSELVPHLQSLNAKMFESTGKEVHRLWRPSIPNIELLDGLLWEGTMHSTVSTNVVELPGLSIRPAVRKCEEPLMIESDRLWQDSCQPDKLLATTGLWGQVQPQPKSLPEEVQQSQKARPLTQRPPRKNKRVTLLPDIVENPEPLPNKRGTLGIFQFPWGERSENATIQPIPPVSSQTFRAMPGTMSSGGPRISAAFEARARQLEVEEYSSSFFDEYDEEEDEGDNFDDEFEDSGDDFDESTLWEIASLLKTDVPSKNSLLPSSLIDDYIAEESSDDEQAEEHYDALDFVSEGMSPATTPLYLRTQDEVIRTSLWMPDAQDMLSRQSFGLAQPDNDMWQRYMSTEDEVIRPRSKIDGLPVLESSQLWTTKSQKSPMKPSLWATGSKPGKAKPSFGLVQPELQVWQTYIPAIVEPVRSQPRIAELDEIESNTLWKSSTTTQKQLDSFLWAPKEVMATKAHQRSMDNTSRPQRRSLMWKKPVVLPEPQDTKLFDTKSLRLDYRRTLKSPIASLVTNKPRTSKEPLQRLNTQNLWKATPKLFARTTGKRQTMWSATSVKVAHTTALFQLDPTRKNYRTTMAEPAALRMMAKPRKSNVSPPQLSSSHMWTSNNTSQKVEINWIKASSQHPKSNVAAPPSSTQSLFQIDPTRKDYRTTSAKPAAFDMVTKPRKTNSTLPQLSSSYTWKPNNNKKVERDWIKMSSTITFSRATAPSMSLFKLDPKRKEWRTTAAEPAALDMVTKSRIINGPLPQLESLRLWSPARTANVQFDWITISSIRPSSPSVASITSSAPSSPMTDASSIRTTSTKASTVALSVSSNFSLRGIFGRRKKASPEIPEVPEDPVLPKIPETPAEPLTPRDSTTQSREMPGYIPSRQQYRNNITYDSDWDAALSEAIRASYPNTHLALTHASQIQWEEALQEAIVASHVAPKIVRRTASPKEWSTALNQAIAASYPHNRFSRGQVLPAQWDKELCEAIARSQRTTFDVAKRHPVFFGSMVTTVIDVHPAAQGFAIRNEPNLNTSPQPLLWTRSSVIPTQPASGAMWTASRTRGTASVARKLQEVESAMVRKPITRAASELESCSDFSSQSMWKRQDTHVQKRNWLGDIMIRLDN